MCRCLRDLGLFCLPIPAPPYTFNEIVILNLRRKYAFYRFPCLTQFSHKASAIAIHGRFREQRLSTPNAPHFHVLPPFLPPCLPTRYHEGVADWNAIRALKKVVGVPVIANGNILGLDDVHKCLQYTGCDGVMSAISILRMPKLFESTLFSGRALEISNYNRELKTVKLQMQLSEKAKLQLQKNLSHHFSFGASHFSAYCCESCPVVLALT